MKTGYARLPGRVNGEDQHGEDQTWGKIDLGKIDTAKGDFHGQTGIWTTDAMGPRRLLGGPCRRVVGGGSFPP